MTHEHLPTETSEQRLSHLGEVGRGLSGGTSQSSMVRSAEGRHPFGPPLFRVRVDNTDPVGEILKNGLRAQPLFAVTVLMSLNRDLSGPWVGDR